MRTASLSGNEITDALRSAAVSGDGRADDSSVGLWFASQNKLNQAKPGITADVGLTVGGDGAAVLSKTTEKASPFVNQVWDYTVLDDFERSDTTPGSLGTAPTGQTWSLEGNGGPYAQIEDGRYVVGQGKGESYARMTMSKAPARIGGRISWVEPTPAAVEVGNAVIVLSKNAAPGFVANAISTHFIDGVLTINEIRNSVFTELHRELMFPITRDGTPYAVYIELDGDTYTVLLTNGQIITFSHPSIEELAGHEVSYNILFDPADRQARWDEVFIAEDVYTEETYVWKLDNSGGAADAYVDFDGTPGSTDKHTLSVWATCTSGAVLSWDDDTDAENIGTGASLARVISPNLTPPSTTAKLRITVPAGESVWFTGAQLEAALHASPLIASNGFGTLRAAARVQLPADVLRYSQGWLAFRVRPGWGNADTPIAQVHALFQWIVDSNNRLACYYNYISDLFIFLSVNAGVTTAAAPTATVTRDTPFTVIIKWSTSGIGISFDGAAFANASGGVRPDLSAVLSFDVGSLGGSSHLCGDFFWVAGGSGSVSDDEAAAIHACGNTIYASNLPSSITFLWPCDTEEFWVPLVRQNGGVGFGFTGRGADPAALWATRKASLAQGARDPQRLWETRRAGIQQQIRERVR